MDPDWTLAMMVLDAFAADDDAEVAAMLDGVASRRLIRVVRAVAAVACMAADELAELQGVD